MYTVAMQRDRWAPVWLMGLSNTTFGPVGGFLVLPLPQLLAAQHVPEARITAITGACFLPGFWVFALGPLLDFRFSRRVWAAVFAVLAGVGMTVAVLLRGNLAVLETGADRRVRGCGPEQQCARRLARGRGADAGRARGR